MSTLDILIFFKIDHDIVLLNSLLQLHLPNLTILVCRWSFLENWGTAETWRALGPGLTPHQQSSLSFNARLFRD